MAKNCTFEPTKTRSVVCTDPTTPASGDPVLFGKVPGVALTAERTDGTTTIALDGVFTLSVKGEGAAAAATAIAAGDIIYYDIGQTPPLNVDGTAGIRFGYARAAVASGATTTIEVEVGY